MNSFLAIFVLFSAWNFTQVGSENAVPDDRQLFLDGNIILGGLFNVHKRGAKSENSCGGLDPNPGYQYFASALFAIKEFNKDSNILPGIKLGLRAYDTCRSQTIGADGAKELIKYTLQQTKATPPMAGVIGPFRSDVAIAVANLLRVFDIPQVSFGATVVKLSDKDIYSYFFRTVPPNSFQGRALVDVVRYFGWNYVMTVFSPGLYGEPGMDEVYSDAKRKGLCIACKIRLPGFPTAADYEQTINDLLEISKRNTKSDLNVVVMFCIQRDNTGLVAAAKKILKDKNTRFVWVASNSWGARQPVTNGNEEGGEGALTLNYIEGKVVKFKDYFLGLNYTSLNETWFHEFWQISMKCRIKGAKIELNFSQPCLEHEKLPPEFGIAPVRVSMNAVYATVYALNDMHKALCLGKPGMCEPLRNLKREEFLKYLRNVSFPDSTSSETIKFNRNGEVDGRYDVLNFRKVKGKYTYLKVGSWSGKLQDDDSVQGGVQINTTLIKWAPTWQSTTPNSYCSRPCSATQIYKAAVTNPECCWHCEKCEAKSFIMNNTCRACAPGSRPNANLTACYDLPLDYSMLSNDAPAQIIVVLLAIIGLIATSVTAGFFIRYRNDRVIKASGKELCIFLFSGVFFCYVSAVLYLVKPTGFLCGARRFLGSVSLTAIYAPVLLRTNRIYRIFKFAQKTVTRPSLISPASQVIMCFGLIAIQILVTSFWFFTDPPRASKSFQYDDRTILECSMKNISVAINLCYNIILMLVATCYAFLTRNFPRNFNEAKYIGITMYLSCSVWVIVLPCYLNAQDSIWKGMFSSYALVLVATFTVGGLLVPRVLLVLKGAVVGPETLTMTREMTAQSAGHTNNFKQNEHGTLEIGLENNVAGRYAASSVDHPQSTNVK